MSKNNVITFDTPPSSTTSKCKDILQNETTQPWEAKCFRSNHLHGSLVKSSIRFIKYFNAGWWLMRNRNKYRHIIAWQQFHGLMFALICRLLRLKKVNDVTVMTFIYKPKKGFLGKIYYWFVSSAVNSRYIDRIICFSKEECEYYPTLFKTNPDLFQFVHLGIEPVNPSITSSKGDFLFATGRSNRDYDFLFDVLRVNSSKCIIACDSLSTSQASENVEILTECHDDAMLSLMAKSHCVLIPLKDANISSGQLVILQAMALGKPIICTDTKGIADYASPSCTLICNNDINEWTDAINQLNDNRELYDKMSDAARNIFETKFKFDSMIKRIAAKLGS